MRKWIALLLTVVLAMGAISSASAARAYTLDIYWIGNVRSGAEVEDDPYRETREGVEAAINAYIEPLINANVSFHIVPWDPVWTAEAIGALMADEKIDLIFTADWEGYVQEILDGKIQPLDSLIDDYAPGIRTGENSLSEDFLNGVRYQNYIYGIPTNKELCVPTGFIVNKTAAAEIGWDVTADDPSIKTAADLEPWLAKYKEKYPDNYPYLMEKGRWADEPWAPDWINLEGNCVAMKMARQENGVFDETIYSIYETEEQEEHIRLMYKWAQEGYIDPNAASGDFNYNQIFGTGNFLVFTQPLKGNGIKSVEMMEANKAEGAEFECVEITMQPKYKVTTQAGGSMFAIPYSSKRPKVAMQYLELMHTDPVLVNLMLYGAENVNYTKVNDAQVEKVDDAHWWYGMHGGAWTVGNTKLQYVLTSEDPTKNALLQEYANDAIATASYGFRFDKRVIPDEVNAVSAVVKEFSLPLLVGAMDPDDPEKGIEAMRRALKEAGMDRLVEAVKTQYSEWKSTLK